MVSAQVLALISDWITKVAKSSEIFVCFHEDFVNINLVPGHQTLQLNNRSNSIVAFIQC